MYSHDILRPAVPQWQGIGCKVGGKAEGVSEVKVYKTAKSWHVLIIRASFP